ncbi:hypothetical protein Cgig2_009738 [Carnegiea gigantea]|uniref:Uncharacterized protein n=1 Tax=Carnegiea gigantea TaxID=171969 RepID=A0A9Q1JZ92_9CARY|nr:hypothetical protein Cgig2_009738 [Carnegiea gigantea]
MWNAIPTVLVRKRLPFWVGRTKSWNTAGLSDPGDFGKEGSVKESSKLNMMFTNMAMGQMLTINSSSIKLSVIRGYERAKLANAKLCYVMKIDLAKAYAPLIGNSSLEFSTAIHSCQSREEIRLSFRYFKPLFSDNFTTLHLDWDKEYEDLYSLGYFVPEKVTAEKALAERKPAETLPA